MKCKQKCQPSKRRVSEPRAGAGERKVVSSTTCLGEQACHELEPPTLACVLEPGPGPEPPTLACVPEPEPELELEPPTLAVYALEPATLEVAVGA